MRYSRPACFNRPDRNAEVNVRGTKVGVDLLHESRREEIVGKSRELTPRHKAAMKVKGGGRRRPLRRGEKAKARAKGTSSSCATVAKRFKAGKRSTHQEPRKAKAHYISWLEELYPWGKRYIEPRFWRDESFNNPSQPVVGISWHEARASAISAGHRSRV